MRTKTIKYQIKVHGEPKSVEGAQINMFTAARKIIHEDKTLWIIDHIPTGSKVWICNTYSEARNVGNAFLLACSKPHSSVNEVVQESTEEKFKDYLYKEVYKEIEDYSKFIVE